MSKVRVAINGFGRIGRLVLRAMSEYDKKGLFEVVAIQRNSATPDQMAYLFKYDSIHGRFNGTVAADENHLIVNGQPIVCVKADKPEQLPWKELGVDIRVQCEEIFTAMHLI